MFRRTKKANELRPSNESALAAVSAVTKALDTNMLELNKDMVSQYKNRNRISVYHKRGTETDLSSLEKRTKRDEMTRNYPRIISNDIYLGSIVSNASKKSVGTQTTGQSNAPDRTQTSGAVKQISQCERGSRQECDELEIVTKYVPGPRGLIKVNVPKVNASSLRQRPSMSLNNYNSNRTSMQASIASSNKTAQTIYHNGKHHFGQGISQENSSEIKSAVKASSNPQAKVNTIKADETVALEKPFSRDVSESLLQQNGGGTNNDKESSTSFSYCTACDDSNEIQNYGSTENKRASKFENQVTSSKQVKVSVVQISEKPIPISDTEFEQLKVDNKHTEVDKFKFEDDGHIPEKTPSSDSVAIFDDTLYRKDKIEKPSSSIKSALKNSSSDSNQPCKVSRRYSTLSVADGAYLSLTTAENTRLNARISSEVLKNTPIKKTIRCRSSVYPSNSEKHTVKHIKDADSIIRKGNGFESTIKACKNRKDVDNVLKEGGVRVHDAAKPAIMKPTEYQKDTNSSNMILRSSPKLNSGFKIKSFREGLKAEGSSSDWDKKSISDKRLSTFGAQPLIEDSNSRYFKETLQSISGTNWKSRFADSDSECEGEEVQNGRVQSNLLQNTKNFPRRLQKTLHTADYEVSSHHLLVGDNLSSIKKSETQPSRLILRKNAISNSEQIQEANCSSSNSIASYYRLPSVPPDVNVSSISVNIPNPTCKKKVTLGTKLKRLLGRKDKT